jgi:hypothetical protein
MCDVSKMTPYDCHCVLRSFLIPTVLIALVHRRSNNMQTAHTFGAQTSMTEYKIGNRCCVSSTAQ